MKVNKTLVGHAILAVMLVLGVFSSAYWVISVTGNEVEKIGQWELVKLAEPGVPERIVLTASVDKDGNPLNPDNAYTIEGKNTWVGEWSIQVVDGRQSLDGLGEDGAALSSKDFVYEPDGSSYRVILARPSINKNWLPIGEIVTPTLVISIGGIQTRSVASISANELPVIKKIGDVRATARRGSKR